MFGNHQLLERTLRRSGRSGLATVVSCHRLMSSHTSYNGGVPSPRALVRVVLRVEPDGEPAFETTTEHWFTGTEGAREGMKVPVLYDPSDHRKLVVDESDEHGSPPNAKTCSRDGQRPTRRIIRARTPRDWRRWRA